MASNDLLLTWLRDAHGMEKTIADFSAHSKKHLEHLPSQATVLGEVNQASIQHRQIISELLQDDDTAASKGKDFIARVSSLIGDAGSNLFGDDQVKDILALYGLLQFAHACYDSLTQAAQTVGDSDVEQQCKRMASEKQTLAARVFDLIPIVTDDALSAK